MYIKTDDTGRLICVSTQSMDESEEFDFPIDFQIKNHHDYKIVDGALIYDPLPEAEQNTSPTTQDQIDANAAAIMELAEIIAGGAS
jgi:hypothetical protein